MPDNPKLCPKMFALYTHICMYKCSTYVRKHTYIHTYIPIDIHTTTTSHNNVLHRIVCMHAYTHRVHYTTLHRTPYHTYLHYTTLHEVISLHYITYRKHMHTYINKYIHTYIHTYIHIFMCIYIYIYLFIAYLYLSIYQATNVCTKTEGPS